MTLPIAIAALSIEVEVAKDADLKIKHNGNGSPPRIPSLPYGPDEHGQDGDARSQTYVHNALLGMLLFLGTDLMFFVALIGAFFVFRLGGMDWPPVGQPRLPIAVTGINTAILLASGFFMYRATRAIRAGNSRRTFRLLALTAGLGTTFLLVQGSEWFRLVGFGLTMSSSVYGAIFYTLIGCHAVHVLGAVLWLLLVMLWAWQKRFSAQRYLALQLCSMYWFLVVALWPVLYVLVYLN